MENKNQNDLSLIQKQKEQINKLKKVILDIYAILKCANEKDSIKIINLTYGVITILVKETIDLNYDNYEPHDF